MRNVQKERFLYIALFGLLSLSLPGQSLRTIDHIYDPNVQTVLLYPVIGSTAASPASTLNPPVIALDEQSALQLEFDDLQAVNRSFRARLVHCNADWQRSVLNDIDFIYEYNDNPIIDYQLSSNTKITYFHYRFTVPKVRLPGNYLLVVYDERNRDNIIFTRRFSTYQNLVQVSAAVGFSTSPERQYTDQQINLSLSYRGYQVISPQDDFLVVIRQNYRDDKEIRGLKPSGLQGFDQLLTYQPVDLSNTMPGGNEYRFFDTRTVLSRANYIDRIDRLADRNVAYVQVDKPRSDRTYIQSDDFNGLFVIDQRETGNGATNADYVETIFTLNIPETPGYEVYVNGAFNFWQLNDRTRMSYDPSINGYRVGMLLKQGVYNYDYALKTTTNPPKADESAIEGNFSGTENDYEIFVYHRPPSSRADLLIAYQKLGVNKRR